MTDPILQAQQNVEKQQKDQRIARLLSKAATKAWEILAKINPRRGCVVAVFYFDGDIAHYASNLGDDEKLRNTMRKMVAAWDEKEGIQNDQETDQD